MNTFSLTISTASKIYFSGAAVYCRVTTLKGAIGFEAHHENFFGVLADNSTIEYKDSSGEENSIDFKSGMISFQNNRCIITLSD